MLTRSGLGAAIAAVVLAGCGLWWHYEELVVIAAAIATAVVIAVWSARTRHAATITRHIHSPRVTRGDPLRAVYRAVNTGRHSTSPVVVIDTCDGAEVRVDVVGLAAGRTSETVGSITTRRRGVFEVGPATVERNDPLGLAVGRRTDDHVSSIIVHPRIHSLHGPYGAMHTVEDEAVMRRAASDPLSGFVSLRDYVDGDDPRLIHWPTTARIGTLMIREHVELRRPEFTVVLDAAAGVASADDFEEMVDVAASIAVHAISSGVSVMLRTTSRRFPGSTRRIDRDTQVLDLLTPVTQAGADDALSLTEVFHGGVDHTMVAFVTGPRGPSTTFSRSDTLSVIRVGADAATTPGVALAVLDAAEFAQRWRPWH